jgi:hypothetical protein
LHRLRQIRDDEDRLPFWTRMKTRILRFAGPMNSSLPRLKTRWRRLSAIMRRIQFNSECGLRSCASTLTAVSLKMMRTF